MKKTSFYDILMAAPLALTAFFVPLWVRLYVIQTPEALQQISFTPSEIGDFFASGKQLTLVCCTVLAIICFVVALCKKTITPSTPILIACGVFTGGVLISFALSQIPETALLGIFGRNTGVLSIICFVCLFLYAALVINKAAQRQFVLYAFLVGGCLVALIAIGQAFDFDIIDTEFFRRLIIPYRYSFSEVEFGIFSAYSTLANPNYTGIYCAVLAVVALGALLYEPRRKHKVFYLICIALGLGGVIAAQSTTAVLGFACAVVIVLIIFGINKTNFKITKLHIIASFFIIATCFTAAILLKPTAVPSRINNDTATKFLGCETRENTIWILTNAGLLGFAKTPEGYTAMQSDGTPLELDFSSNAYHTVTSQYENLAFVVQGEDILFVMPDMELFFNFERDEFWLNLANGYLAKTERSQGITLLNPLDGFASGRVYIYSRSLPIVWRNLLFGTGPDSFACMFPQRDMSSKINAFNDAFLVIDKPHSLYLQIVFENGVIALLGFVTLCALALKRAYAQMLHGNMLSLALIGGCVAFLFCGLANDLTIGMAPTFWIMLGLCVSSTAVSPQRKSKKRRA